MPCDSLKAEHTALKGSQVNNIQQALLTASTRQDLEQLMRIHLNTRLKTIADGRNLTDIVFNLINGAVQDAIYFWAANSCPQNW